MKLFRQQSFSYLWDIHEIGKRIYDALLEGVNI